MNGPNDLDRVLGFAIPSRSARGRIVRLGPVLDRVRAAGVRWALVLTTLGSLR